MTATIDQAPDQARRPSPARAAGERSETLVARIAIAAIAIAVVDDAFVHREPGTAIGDHLASGLIPTGLAILLAVRYPRVRPGLAQSARSSVVGLRSSPASSTACAMSRPIASPATT